MLSSPSLLFTRLVVVVVDDDDGVFFFLRLFFLFDVSNSKSDPKKIYEYFSLNSVSLSVYAGVLHQSTFAKRAKI